MSDNSQTMDIEQLRQPGQVLYFEYRCWESDNSSDAQLWYHSHQKVTVVSLDRNDGYDPEHGVTPIPSFVERMECGHPICYVIRFTDGFEGTATEDELLDSSSEYERHDPPKH